MYDVDWTKIKNGASGFEALAREYVKDIFNFPQGTWKKSPDTHDGNKDAYTIIIGFHPTLDEQEVWWMEAKYSLESIYLSRFKLDATIVSSIFNRSVKKIIFITNIEIKAKVISDVRTALYNGTNCKETYFCTKKALELWLYNNPSIFKKYFTGALPIPSNFPDLFVSEDITIYSISNMMRESDPLYSIISNKPYEAHFKIIANCNQRVKIITAQKGIKRLTNLYVDIQTGENVITVQFLIQDKFFSYKKRTYDGIEENNLCFFKINGKVPLMIKYPINILYNQETKLKISSQIRFEEKLTKFKINQYASYWIIDGKAGCGKTTVVQRCAEAKAIQLENYRYIKFINDNAANNFEIISALFFVLFPYMYIEDITSEFLETLSINLNLKKKLIYFRKNINKSSYLINYIKNLSSPSSALFPENLNLNPKIIVFDDVHLLNDNSMKLLFYILKESHKLPITFILTGHSYLWEQPAFLKYSISVIFEKYHFELSTDDIINNMQRIFSFTFDISKSLLEYFFPNIIVFNIYVNYVNELYECINSIDDFVITYISFKQNYISNEYINRQFQLLYESYPSAWELCKTIYTGEKGVNISEEIKDNAGLLIKMGLIKYNEYNRLVPSNEIYKIHYQKKQISITNTVNHLEQIIVKLINMSLPSELEECYNTIHQMRNEEEFQTVNYILETVFEYTPLDDYRNMWGAEIFNLLYYEYTYASINCNSNITGYDNLKIIYDNIKGTSSIRLSALLLEIIFELINCEYNNGKYSKCREYFETFQKHFLVLSKKGIIDSDYKQNLFWVLCSAYMILIDSEENKKDIIKKAIEYRNFLKINYHHHYIDFCRQFSKTLYIKDWNKAYEWQKLAYDEVIKQNNLYSKQALKVRFDFYFAQYMQEENASYLTSMKEQLLLTKERYYSSYRHQLFLYCGLLYILGSIDEADSLFFIDIVNVRPIRQKMKGHYYLLLSLHFLKHNDLQKAQTYIKQSIDIFETLETDRTIVIHNQIVLQANSINQLQYAFYKSGSLQNNTFYLDPRM